MGRDPTAEEAALEVEFPPARVVELTKLAQDPVSLDAPAGRRRFHSGGFVPDRRAGGGGRRPRRLQEYAAPALDGLTERERGLVLLRFGLGAGGPSRSAG